MEGYPSGSAVVVVVASDHVVAAQDLDSSWAKNRHRSWRLTVDDIEDFAFDLSAAEVGKGSPARRQPGHLSGAKTKTTMMMRQGLHYGLTWNSTASGKVFGDQSWWLAVRGPRRAYSTFRRDHIDSAAMMSDVVTVVSATHAEAAAAVVAVASMVYWALDSGRDVLQEDGA